MKKSFDKKSGNGAEYLSFIEKLSCLKPSECKKLVSKRVKQILKNPTGE